jgi:hypothetical protein
MAIVQVGKGMWKPLLVNGNLESIIKQLATSQTYLANGVLLSFIGIPLSLVQVVVFPTILGSHIYNCLISMRHLHGSANNSYIDVDYYSNTLSSVFSHILHLDVIEHQHNHIRI